MIANTAPSRNASSTFPRNSTLFVWALAVASIGCLGVWLTVGGPWRLGSLAVVDGLTALTWCGVTLLSGIVHSYARRYLHGDRGIVRFFVYALAFTLSVMVLVAANHLALFAVAWLVMGLTMAELIGHVRGWEQARRARSLARRSFVGSTALVVAACATLWLTGGAVTVEEAGAVAATLPPGTRLFVGGALLGAALIQSALIPFQGWLLSSMTAPTPASALMHAGFVNAGGLLFARFYPVFSQEAVILWVAVGAGALSAIAGKFLKSVRSDVKGQLGCSTVGQMGFMVMQAGLGFVAAAVTHLILHGFYKAYLFLSSGERVEQTAPPAGPARNARVVPRLAAVVYALLGAGLFLLWTGKGLALDGGAVLALLVALATYRATREVARRAELSASLRYLGAPVVFLAAVGLYSAIYLGVEALMGTQSMVMSHTIGGVGTAVLGGLFAATYLFVDTESYQISDRLYVALLNVSTSPDETILTSKEDYREC